MRKISVIIPVKNEEKIIGSLMSSLLSQDYKGWYEIIVVNDHSSDRTGDIVKTFVKNSKKVKYFNSTENGPAAARNVAIKKAKGDVILFTDGDCLVPRNWITKI